MRDEAEIGGDGARKKHGRRQKTREQRVHATGDKQSAERSLAADGARLQSGLIKIIRGLGRSYRLRLDRYRTTRPPIPLLAPTHHSVLTAERCAAVRVGVSLSDFLSV